ncbi:cytochrome c oxidase assembly protein [Brevibacillus massiliensis]|uniref:cytochrome c oxidase assembly protein n=1 Tax=Brevibacillus massiliensis TaxID=1118054 RepID=UPI0002EB6F4D|nr:cytochrome c oxidase assembly protein [Brevibacillus massiliensis]
MNSLLSPAVLLLTVLLAVLYFAAVGPFGRRTAGAEPTSLKKQTLFVIGLLLLYLGYGPGNHYAQTFFSVYVTQQAIVNIVTPIFFLLGLPTWLVRSVFRTKSSRLLLRVVTFPPIAMVLFDSLFSLFHLPSVFDSLAENGHLYEISRIFLLLAACCMWWPIFTPVKEWRLTDIQKIGYLVVSGLLLFPISMFLLFADAPLFTAYQTIPELYPGYTALDDQQLGAIILKVCQIATYAAVFFSVFTSWYRKEDSLKATDAVDPAASKAAASMPQHRP